MKIPFIFSQSSRWSRLIRLSGYTVGVLLVLALISWLTVPSYLKSTLEQQVEAHTGRQFKVGAVGFNPFTLTVSLSQIQFMEADKKSAAFSADQLVIRASLMSVFHAAPVIKAVMLTHPHLQLLRTRKDGKEVTNFSDVVELLEQHPGKGDPLRFSVSNIELDNGEIELDDQLVGKQVHIQAMKLALPFLSNFPTALDIYVEPYLGAIVNGSKVELKARSRPFEASLDTSVAIDIERFNLTQVLAFSPKSLPLTVKSALLSTHLTLSFSEQQDHQRISLSGTANLNDVTLEDKNGAPLYASKQINFNVQEANLVNQHIVLNSLNIVEPQIWAGFNQQGGLNWLALQGKPAADLTSASPSAVPIQSAPAAVAVGPTGSAKPATAVSGKTDDKPVIELAHFQIKGGTLHWSDAANASPAMLLTVSNIAVNAAHISTKEGAEAATLQVSMGEAPHQQLHFEGLLNPHTASVSGQLRLSEFALEDYQPYANRYVDGSIAGTLALQTKLDIVDGNVAINELSAGLENLNVQAAHREWGSLSAKKIALDKFSMSTGTRQIKLAKLEFNQVQGDLFRTAEGGVNVVHLIKQSTAAVTSAVSGKSATPSAISSTKSAQAWQVDFDEVALNDSHFTFGDRGVQPAVTIKGDDVNIKLEHGSSDPTKSVKVTLRATLNNTGKFFIDGSASAKAAQMNVDVQNFAIAVLQPYFTQFLNISVEKGNVSTKGTAAWAAGGAAGAEIRYNGGLKLANFITSDKETTDDFLTWKLLEIAAINVDLGGKQPSVTLGKINLTDFYARAILSEQGKLNLQQIIAHPTPPTPAAAVAGTESAGAPPIAVAQSANGLGQTMPVVPVAMPTVPVKSPSAPAPVITLGAINLNNGIINYTDNFINPHYTMRMTGMTGSVGAIRSNLAQSAPISINGKVDGDAPIAISGSLNPLFNPMLLDVRLTADGVDLPKLTTYALKYAGYPIVKGKLSLDVDYHIKDNQLMATNSLKIDQLTFGDKVDGPDATHLPVPFLISLLTDSDGRINLDLPISGTINDPQFSIGGIIVDVLLNVLKKVVTSPFSLLSHVFGDGGGEEMAYIEFDPGSSKLNDAGKAKLDKLAQALTQRPQLKMDIIGRADIAADQAGLREHILESQIKKSKNLEEEATDFNQVSQAERDRAVNKIYSSAKFDKPHNAIGFAKTLPTAEMEKLIVANTKVGDDEIRALALRRESVVHAYLTDTAHVASERLFSVAPKLSGDDIKDQGAISRVDFELKM